MRVPTDPLTFADRAAWRAWLEEHHATEKEAWLVLSKKGVVPATVAYEEAVEEALCFGWIDGSGRRLDEEHFLLRYTPRRRGSVWAESNKRRVERLMREGRMAEAGLRAVREAQESGQWQATAQWENVSALPPDLEEALRARDGAQQAFAALPASAKKQYLWWISDAKREETRRKRIQAAVDRIMEAR